MKQEVVFVGFCLALLMAQTAGAQRTITVGQGAGYDQASIQAAINASVEGDLVIVFPGTYVESISFRGKNIALTSSDPSNPSIVASTIIDGNGQYAVVSFAGTEDAKCLLQGFTVRNGEYGISGKSCQARISGNIITNNKLVGMRQCNGMIELNTITFNVHGGLAACTGIIQSNLIANNPNCGLQDCQGTIRSNTIQGNMAVNGAGLYWCSGTIADNLIADNYASQSGGGLAKCSGLVVGNRIIGNMAASGGGLAECGATIRANTIAGNVAASGGGIYSCQGVVENNLIAGNSVTGIGGGVAYCHLVVRNCTIVDNWALGGPKPGKGGGLAACIGSIENCIIWGNSATAAADAQLHQCSAPSYSCIQGWTGGGEGNIPFAPAFVDADGLDNNPSTWEDNDYHLLAYSACIDAGDPSPGANDGARPPGLRSERNDMGAQGGPNNGAWPAVLPRSPDLSGALISLGHHGGIVSGKPFVMNGSITNYGSLPCTAKFWVDFVAVNQDTQWRGTLCHSLLLEPLGVGESFDLSGLPRPRNAYGGIPAGKYTIEMYIDPVCQIPEWNKANNVVVLNNWDVLPNQSNLMLTGFDFAPEAVKYTGGDVIQFAGTVENTGTQPTFNPFWIEFRICEVGKPEPSCCLCDSLLVDGSLGSGETIDLSLITRTTYPLLPGMYTVGVVLDPLDSVQEQREGDNVVWLVQKKLKVGAHTTRAKSWRLYR